MTREEFFDKINRALENLPAVELRKANTYYSELIDDYIEDGMTEEEAIDKLGSIKEITDAILMENSRMSKNNYQKTKRSALSTVLIVLGFPLWLPLLMVGFSLLLVAYILIYIPLLVFWPIAVSFFAGSIIIITLSPFTLHSNIPLLTFQIGVAIFLLGLSLVLFIFSKYLTKNINFASVKIWRWVSGFIKKGRYGNE